MMEMASNSGLIVVNLDGCLTPAGEQSDIASFKTDCIYTVSMMAPEDMIVPDVNTTCLQESLDTPDVPAQQSNDTQYQITQTVMVPSCDQDNSYYDLILKYLRDKSFPEGVEESRRNLIVKRSRHYSIIDEQLFYGHEIPKKVVPDVGTRNKLMKNVHVIEESGVHIGVQKMYSQLKKEYFWCGMYLDVTKFVKCCRDCIDADLPLAAVKTLARKQKLHLRKKVVRVTRSQTAKYRKILSKENIGTWKQVELRLSGPYPENRFVLTIADPSCCWVEAKVVQKPDLGTQASNFLVSTFMQLGFAHVSAVGFKSNMIKTLKRNYLSQFNKITGSSANKVCNLGSITDIQTDIYLCPWISELLQSLMSQYPNSWEEEMPKFLFSFRNTPGNKNSESPFKIMYDRPAIFVSQEENKENVGRRRSTRLQRSNLLVGKKRRSNIESRIVTRALKQGRERLARAAKKQNKAETEISGDEDDPCSLNTTEETIPQEVVSVAPKETVIAEVEEVRASTVAAVQAYLTATRKERSRRGQYQRYSPEQQDEIAKYALQHGSLAAVKYFSEKFNVQISESTIRNFAKNYKSFSAEIQEQVGAYYFNHSLEETSQHFSSLGYNINANLLKKFRKKFVTKHIPVTLNVGKSNINNEKDIYGENLKLEIGEYATRFGISDTIEHFNKKLNINLKENNVSKCKKYYLEKNQSNSGNQESLTTLSDPETMQTDSTESGTLQGETMEVVQTSFNTLNTNPQTIVYNQSFQPLISPIFHQNSTTVDQTSVATYQPSIPQVVTHNPQIVFSQTPFHTHSTYTPNFNQLHTSNIQVPNHTPDTNQLITTSENTSLNINNHCSNTQMIISQHPILITQTQGNNNVTVHLDHLASIPTFETQLPHQHDSNNSISFLHQPSTINYSSTNTTEVTPNVNNTTSFNSVDTIENNIGQMISVIQVEPNIVTSENISNQITKPVEVQLASPATSNTVTITESQKPKKATNKNKKSEKKVKERNNYVTYSPELRAEIGRFAAEHGNIQAINHFEVILGKKLPESTVRGLKEKYLAKMQLCSSSSGINKTEPIKSLGFAPRGRPMRLGKYDDVVRRCIQDLVSNGERVTSFLAITTARQILLEREPQLLAENGGSVKLSANWAKSFLKRIGIHNNS